MASGTGDATHCVERESIIFDLAKWDMTGRRLIDYSRTVGERNAFNEVRMGSERERCNGWLGLR